MMVYVYMDSDIRHSSRYDPVFARFHVLYLVEPTIDSESWSFRFGVAEIN